MSRHPEPRRPARLVPTSRPGGSTRLLVELDAADARAYERAVSQLTPQIERSLGPGVLANRARGRGVVKTVRLEPWIPAWRRWRRAVRNAGRGHPWLVLADVATFYPSVDEPTLRRAFPYGADPVLDVLRVFWEDGVTGLPIGPAASAILANALLAPVDEAIRAIGSPLRWVDDWVIGASSREGAGRLLVVLEGTLRELGLALNPAKTEVLAAGSADRLLRPRGSAAPGSAVR